MAARTSTSCYSAGSGSTFYAFDLLMLNGRDLRGLPLTERKRRLAAIMPVLECRVRFLDSIAGRGCDLFRAACEHDLEGIVAKWAHGTVCNGLAPHVLAQDQESRVLADCGPPRVVRGSVATYSKACHRGAHAQIGLSGTPLFSAAHA